MSWEFACVCGGGGEPREAGRVLGWVECDVGSGSRQDGKCSMVGVHRSEMERLTGMWVYVGRDGAG